MSTEEEARQVRLNLGCGNDPLAGFLNIDVRGEGADLLMDVRRLGVGDRTVTALRAYHLLEHLGYVDGSLALAEWYRVLEEGAELTIETPDLPKSMELFLAGDFDTRARLVNWIYGLESKGMGHRIGFELALLEKMLSQAGFADARSEQPTSHTTFPGLRVSAVKSRSSSHDVRSELLRRVPFDEPGFGDQAVMLELIDRVVPEILSVFSETDEIDARLSTVLAHLVVYHCPIARVVAELGRPQLREETFRAWVEALGGEDAAELGAQLTAELLSRPIQPGAMEATFREARDAGRALASTLIGSDSSTRAQLDRPRASIAVVPFSRAGLVREAWGRHGRGARLFARGDFDSAGRHLEIAARLNSDQHVLLWNLARLASVRGDLEDAVTWLDRAIIAAERTGATSCLGELREELSAAQSGRRLEAALVSPSSQAGGEGGH